MLDYNPILPDIQNIIKKHFHLLRSSPQNAENFRAKSVFPAYRRTKNLKEVLAPFKLRQNSAANQMFNEGACLKCDKNRCDLCKNFLLQASKFQSSATGRHYPIRQKLPCSSKNIIYLATCYKCNLQYVESFFIIKSPDFSATLSTISDSNRSQIGVSGLGLGIRYLPLLGSMAGHHRVPNSPPCSFAFS